MDKDDVLEKLELIDKLKKEVSEKYYTEINVNSREDVYDKMIKHLCAGDLDDLYIDTDIPEGRKDEVLSIIHKYQDLCFFNKDVDFWIDSVDGASVGDYDLIVYQILDNFEFLTRLYLKAGERALILLSNLDKTEEYSESLSIVETIRRAFASDDILYEVFKVICQKNSIYNMFNTLELLDLLLYAEGTLYSVQNEEAVINNPIYLGLEIYKRLNIEEIDMRVDLKTLINNLTSYFSGCDDFTSILKELYFDYQTNLELDYDKVDSYKIVIDIDGKKTKGLWDM